MPREALVPHSLLTSRGVIMCDVWRDIGFWGWRVTESEAQPHSSQDVSRIPPRRLLLPPSNQTDAGIIPSGFPALPPGPLQLLPPPPLPPPTRHSSLRLALIPCLGFLLLDPTDPRRPSEGDQGGSRQSHIIAPSKKSDHRGKGASHSCIHTVQSPWKRGSFCSLTLTSRVPGGRRDRGRQEREQEGISQNCRAGRPYLSFGHVTLEHFVGSWPP